MSVAGYDLLFYVRISESEFKGPEKHRSPFSGELKKDCIYSQNNVIITV